MAFIHLRVHTEYSIVDGTLRIDEAVGAAADDSQGALAITDLSNLFGAVKLYSAARKKGVKPIIGADLWLDPVDGAKTASRLLVLAQNRQGYLNLCELLSRAWLRQEQRAHASVEWAWLAELGAGLIALSGADMGAVGQALMAGDDARAEGVARKLAALFPNRYYIELQRAGLAGNEVHVRAAVRLAAALDLPVVATHPVQFA
ncbi:MAG: PHP domain-containing protein, partial [Burkholderiales bacterium]|nr:PHP domain-containing protein [Burkholderiales bacterium]